MKLTDINHVDISLWGKLMGKLAIDNKGIGFFKYSDDFLATGLQPSPITMPAKKGMIYSFPRLNTETFKGLPGMIADSLPDAYGDRLLDIYFNKEGIKNSANIQLLKLCYIHHKAIGALEYAPPLKSLQSPSKELVLSDLMGTVDKLISSKKNLSEGDLTNIQDIISIGSSLGGAAPKAVIGIDFTTNSIRPGNIELSENYEYWIIKFDAIKRDQNLSFTETKGFCNVEYVYFEMAQHAGIYMNPCKLIEDDNRFHFLTKRFDRENGNKLHMQSLHAMAHMDSYQIWDYDMYFRVFTKLKLPYADHEELYKRIVFNGLSGNTDTHTKNTSFLMDEKGTWKLSPYYDVICSVPLASGIQNHKTLINGKANGFGYKDYVEVAERNGIKKYDQIIEQIINSLQQWPELSKNHHVKKEYQEHVQKIIQTNIELLGKKTTK